MSKQPDPPSSDSLETLRSAAGIGSKRPDRPSYGVSETAIIRMRRQDSARRVGVGTIVGIVLLLAAAAGLWWWWAPTGSDAEAVVPARTESEEVATSDEAEDAVSEGVAEDPDPATLEVPRELSPQERLAVREQVTERILAWAEAWSRKDVDRYLAFYSAEFTPESGTDRESWAASRRRALDSAEWLRASVTGLEISDATAETAVATFTQTLRVEGQEDVVRKELALRLDEEGWQIVGERVL